MLLDLLTQHQLRVLGTQQGTVLPHVEVVLLLFEGSHLLRVDLTLFVEALEDTVDTAFGDNEQLVEDFGFVEVELQFGHHLIQ